MVRALRGILYAANVGPEMRSPEGGMSRRVRHLLTASLCLVAAACAASARPSRPNHEIAASSTACELHRLLMDTTRFAESRRLLGDTAHAATVKRLSASVDSVMADTALQSRLTRLMADTVLQAQLGRMMVDTAIRTRFVPVSLQLDSLLIDPKRACAPRRPS